MTMKRWNGSSWVDLTVAKKWNGAAWVDLTLAKRWNGTSWVDIPLPGGGGGALSVTASPGYAFGEINVPNAPYPSAVTVASNNVVLNITGGTGTLSISWARVSGTTKAQVSNPSGSTVQFTATLTRNNFASETWRATVTKGAETLTVDIPVELSYTVGNPL